MDIGIDFILEYLDILDTMAELNNETGQVLYGLDSRRTEVHLKICDYYNDICNTTIENTKAIFSNLDRLFNIEFPPKRWQSRNVDAKEIEQQLIFNRRYFNEEDCLIYFYGTHAKINRSGRIFNI